MTSNANPRSETPSAKATPTARGAAQAPAVPISLYREVANELQTAKSDLHSLKTENQHLIQQNQQLRLEIERVVQSTLHLRQLADSYRSGQGTLETFSSHLETLDFNAPAIAPASGSFNTRAAKLPAASEAAHLVSTTSANDVPDAPTNPAPTPVLRGQESQPHPIATVENSGEISTWWLVLVVCLIVVSAFGTGFLIVRPLLPSR
jgi:hypothetical protein